MYERDLIWHKKSRTIRSSKKIVDISELTDDKPVNEKIFIFTEHLFSHPLSVKIE